MSSDSTLTRGSYFFSASFWPAPPLKNPWTPLKRAVGGVNAWTRDFLVPTCHAFLFPKKLLSLLSDTECRGLILLSPEAAGLGDGPQP